jgi:hypothetical protein
MPTMPSRRPCLAGSHRASWPQCPCAGGPCKEGCAPSQVGNLFANLPAGWQTGAAETLAKGLACARRVSPSSRRAPRGGSLLVQASWGADVQFTPAKILDRQPAATQLHRILVDLNVLAEGYTQPGQFVQIKVRASRGCRGPPSSGAATPCLAFLGCELDCLSLPAAQSAEPHCS